MRLTEEVLFSLLMAVTIEGVRSFFSAEAAVSLTWKAIMCAKITPCSSQQAKAHRTVRVGCWPSITVSAIEKSCIGRLGLASMTNSFPPALLPFLAAMARNMLLTHSGGNN